LDSEFPYLKSTQSKKKKRAERLIREEKKKERPVAVLNGSWDRFHIELLFTLLFGRLFVLDVDGDESLDLRDIDEGDEGVHLVLGLLILVTATGETDTDTVGDRADSLEKQKEPEGKRRRSGQ
jgi:hypothetical protein